MSLLNKGSAPNYGGHDENQLALEIMDKTLLAAPPHAEFRISDLIPMIESKDYNSNIIPNLNSKIDDLLTKTFKYADRSSPGRYSICLTDKGRLVKSQGGHFEYIMKCTNEYKIKKEREELNDEKLHFDIKNSKRVYGTYWYTFTFALVSFMESVK